MDITKIFDSDQKQKDSKMCKKKRKRKKESITAFKWTTKHRGSESIHLLCPPVLGKRSQPFLKLGEAFGKADPNDVSSIEVLSLNEAAVELGTSQCFLGVCQPRVKLTKF